MRHTIFLLAFVLSCLFSLVSGAGGDNGGNSSSAAGSSKTISPQVVVVTMFKPERDAWSTKMNFTQSVNVTGASPLFPSVDCDDGGKVCIITTGEGEINAASTMTALALSDSFNLTQSYFVVNGICGVNPDVATIGSVGFPHYVVQVMLQYGLDARTIPDGWNFSMWNFGTDQPGQYPGEFWGTEVFQLNTRLQDKALGLLSNVTLEDNDVMQKNRDQYLVQTAKGKPMVFQGDVVTSDLYWSGEKLGDMVTNLTSVLTNGSATYALTAQEDSATLEALVRATKGGKADFGRVILYRSASDFDRAPPGMSDYDSIMNQRNATQQDDAALANLFNVGTVLVDNIVNNWDDWKDGVQVQGSDAYGDVFGTIKSGSS